MYVFFRSSLMHTLTKQAS